MSCEHCEGEHCGRRECAEAAYPDKAIDANGWPVVVGARVYVPERPGLAGNATVGGFSGYVTAVVSAQRVDIEEFGTFHFRSVRPADVKVQQGESKASREHVKAREAMRGTTRRGRKSTLIQAQSAEDGGDS